MRSPTEHAGADGVTTWKVRFRHAGTQTSRTFLAEADANTFATLLDVGGVAEALTWLENREAGQRTGWTFAEWFEHYVDHLTGVTVRTKADYRAQRRRYLTSLDPLPLSQLSRPHVANIVNSMDAAGLSPKTIANAINLLASCLAAAVDEAHLSRNPAKKMRLPRTGEEADEDTLFLTHADFARLLAEIPEHYQPLVLTLAGTGLRWSEATALEARHVNQTGETIAVRQAWKRVPGEGFKIGPPKTKRSRRTVNAPPQVIDALRPLLRRPSDLVFVTPSGKPVSHANFHHRIWLPAVKRAELDPRPTIHALRHTHASWLISLGIQLEAVQDQLGHESILTTRGTYGHLLPALGARVAQAAAAALAEVQTATASLSSGISGQALPLTQGQESPSRSSNVARTSAPRALPNSASHDSTSSPPEG